MKFRDNDLLEYWRNFTLMHGTPPTLTRAAGEFNVNSASIHGRMVKLSKQGLVHQPETGHKGTWHLTEKPQDQRVQRALSLLEKQGGVPEIDEAARLLRSFLA